MILKMKVFGYLNIDDVQKSTAPEPDVTEFSDASQESNIQTTRLDDIIEPSGSQGTGLDKVLDEGANNAEQNQGTESAPIEEPQSGTTVTAIRQRSNIQPYLKK